MLTVWRIIIKSVKGISDRHKDYDSVMEFNAELVDDIMSKLEYIR